MGAACKLSLFFFYQSNLLHHFALLDLFSALFLSGLDLYSHRSPLCRVNGCVTWWTTCFFSFFIPLVHSLHIDLHVFDTSTFSGLANILGTHFIWKHKNVLLVISMLVYKIEEANGLFLPKYSGIIHLFHWHRDQQIQGGVASLPLIVSFKTGGEMLGGRIA